MRFLLAAVAVVLSMTSCDEFKSFIDNPVQSYLEVKSEAVTIVEGETYDLKVSTISDQPITLTSSDEKVVTVSAEGVITAIAVGKATITVSVPASANYAAATKQVEVEVVSVLKNALENGAKIGFSFNLNGEDVDYLFEKQGDNYVLLPQNQLQQGAPQRRAVVESQLVPVLIYAKTNNTLILTVFQQVGEDQSLVLMVIFNLNDNTIQIIPGSPLTKVLNFKVRIGTVEITASLKKKEVAPTGITLNKSELELVVDQPEALVAYVEPIDATDKSVTWTSDKPEVATVDEEGTVTGVAEGEANITAQIGQFSATCKVTVAPAVNPNAYLAWNGKQKKLVTTDIPGGATKVQNSSQNVTWAAGTYVVESNVTINGTIELSGAVELIIKDGAKLTVYGQIDGGTNKLYIYGQAGMSGELVVNCSNDNAISDLSTLEVHSAKVKATSSCDYRGGIVSIVAFNVYDGSVEAKGTAANGYGIHLNEGGSMNIYGGEVKAEGKGYDALCCYGILCDSNNKATVTVYGGKLWAGNANNKALNNITLTIEKSPSFNVEIECSSDNSTWNGTVGTPDSKYVRVGY